MGLASGSYFLYFLGFLDLLYFLYLLNFPTSLFKMACSRCERKTAGGGARIVARGGRQR